MSKPSVPASPPAWVVSAAQSAQRGVNAVARGMTPPQFALLELATGVWRFHALVSLARTGVAAALDQGPRTAAELAEQLDLNEDAVFRVLRALSVDGWIVRSGERFSHSAASACLSPEHPNSFASTVLDRGQEHRVTMWARMDHTLRTGQPAWDTMERGTFWDDLDASPERAALFDGSMAEFTRSGMGPQVRAYNFGQHQTVVDVGGGTGTLLSAILSLHPGLQGVLYDREGAVSQAGPVLAAWEVADRVTCTPGDIMAGVPEGYDAYVARNILHMLDDPIAEPMLTAWRANMKAGAKLVIIDMVVPEQGAYLGFLDMVMLVAAGGRERTRAQWEALLGRSGFRLEKVIPTASPLSVLVIAPQG